MKNRTRKYHDAASTLAMASDPTRLVVLLSLAESERNVTELVALAGGSQPAVSHHLSLLRLGRIVDARRDGKRIYYGLTPRGRALVDAMHPLVDAEVVPGGDLPRMRLRTRKEAP